MPRSRVRFRESILLVLVWEMILRAYTPECLRPCTAANPPGSVWRLLNDTDDWPLALCDYTTVDQESDILLNDSIRQDMIDETSLLHHNEAQKWYYLPNQTQQDLFVFRQTDSTGQRASKSQLMPRSTSNLTLYHRMRHLLLTEFQGRSMPQSLTPLRRGRDARASRYEWSPSTRTRQNLSVQNLS